MDQALLSDSFFREELAADVAAQPGFQDSFDELVPILLLQGAALSPDTEQRAGQVGIQGVGEEFIRPLSERTLGSFETAGATLRFGGRERSSPARAGCLGRRSSGSEPGASK